MSARQPVGATENITWHKDTFSGLPVWSCTNCGAFGAGVGKATQENAAEHRCPLVATDRPDEPRDMAGRTYAEREADWEMGQRLGENPAQPQPTDAIRELAENLRNSGREWVHAATIADNIIGVLDGCAAGFGSGPDFVGAVAEIRALCRFWRETSTHLMAHDPNIATAFVRCAEQVEERLNKAGCP